MSPGPRLAPAAASTVRDPAARGRLTAAVAAGALVLLMMRISEFDPRVFLDGQAQAPLRAFLAGFLPPALEADFLRRALHETWMTVAMATCGMFLAMLLAVPAALMLTGVLSVSALGLGSRRPAPMPRLLRRLVRLAMVFLRSVPELVWALALVRVVGLGPAAGVFAIAITYAGMLAKVYAEILESAPGQPALALLHQGSTRVQAFLYGLLPQCSEELISYTVYRWECGIRTSVVLGFVGAGGLGQLMDYSVKMFQGGEVCTLLLIFFALVGVADGASAVLRRAWA